MQENIYSSSIEEFDEDLNLNFKKMFMILWSRKNTVIVIFGVVLLFFMALTFVLPKKYKVEADIYINKSNNTNLMEINPYAIEELGAFGGFSQMMSGSNGLTNELEIIQSPLVIDKVIKDNDLRVKKLFGIIPNRREGEYISTKAFLKKNISFENKKGTNVVSIEYKAKKPDLAYNVVESIITNYVDVLKQLHSEKAKNDTKILEEEYKKVKSELNNKMEKVGGLPPTAVAGTANLAAMGAFSQSARQALSSVQGQVLSGTKSQIALQEETEKLTQIATKLEWAKMVEEMSDSSKVLILKEPVKLRDFEYYSPKLLINILLGIIFGTIAAIIAVAIKEYTDKNLPYSLLGDNVIYKDKKQLFNIQKFFISYKDEKINCILFDNPQKDIADILSEFKNVNIIEAKISSNLIDNINKSDLTVLLCKIGKTDTDLYKSVKEILQLHNKKIAQEILI